MTYPHGSPPRRLPVAIVAVVLAACCARGDTPAGFYPNDAHFAPDLSVGYPGQWYLQNLAPSQMTIGYLYMGQLFQWTAANAGLDADLVPAWRSGLTGQGVVIGIVGITGIQGDHPDLAPNYRPDLSRQFSQDPAIAALPQGPVLSTDNHDTAVAGIAAARGGNGIGITGAAPYAGLAGFRVDNPDDTINPASNQNYVDANYFASGVASDGRIQAYPQVSVRNRSYARTEPWAVEDPRVIQSLDQTADNDVINVFAAGNFRGSPCADTGRMQRNELVSAIAVAALGSDGKFADYSSYGASVFVTAPGARLDLTGLLQPTTDRTGSDGYDPGSPTGIGDPFPDPDYTSIFNGTSGTAPIVSGIMALGQQMDPFLDVRTARHALAHTSRVVDSGDSSATGGWQTNGAGLKFDPNYGFGLVDAGAFVDEVERIAYVTAPEAYATGAKSPSAANFVLSPSPKTEPIVLDAASFASAGVDAFPIEAVEVTLQVSGPDRDALQGTLTSPAGTTSTFLTTSSQSSGNLPLDDPTPSAGLDWTFAANNFWGETPFGTWKLALADLAGNASKWTGYSVTFHVGKMVLESSSLAITANTAARSAELDLPSTAMSVAHGVTFSVRDEFWINAGTLQLDGTLREAAPAGPARSRLRLNGGYLTGDGTVATSLGVLNEEGTVRPGDPGSAGTLAVQGAYTQAREGTLEIDLAHGSPTLAITGTANLAGTLLVDLPASQGAGAFTVLTAGAVSGGFDRVLFSPGLDPRFFPKLASNGTSVTLTLQSATEAPRGGGGAPSLGFDALGAALLAVGALRRRAALIRQPA